MRKASLWAACVGLMWSATASAIPVYYTYGYFGAGSSHANGDEATFSFTMEYDLALQAVYLNDSNVLVTQQDLGLHTNPADPWVGYHHLDYFHSRLVSTSSALNWDLSLPNESTSFRQIASPSPQQPDYEDVIRWQSGDYSIQLVRQSVIDAPIGHFFPFIADIALGPDMVCTAPCGSNLHLVGVSSSHSIPEPATLGLLALGAGLAVGVRRRRERSALSS